MLTEQQRDFIKKLQVECMMNYEEEARSYYSGSIDKATYSTNRVDNCSLNMINELITAGFNVQSWDAGWLDIPAQDSLDAEELLVPPHTNGLDYTEAKKICMLQSKHIVEYFFPLFVQTFIPEWLNETDLFTQELQDGWLITGPDDEEILEEVEENFIALQQYP